MHDTFRVYNNFKDNKMINSYNEKFIAKQADCISTIDSSLPSVLGTYTIVKWMEIASAKCINQYLDLNKYITVGEQISIEHTSMVKLSEKVKIVANIIKEENRAIFFEIKALCNSNVIATATHKRTKIPLKLLKRLT